MPTPDRTLRILLAGVVLAAGCSTSGSSTGPLPLRQVAELRLPGDTSRMDYATIDTTRHRLFIAHLGASQMIVVDTDTKRVTGTIDHVDDVHGVLAVPELNRLFATATGADEVITYDATTLREVGRVRTASSPDGLTYDPDTGSVFVSNESGPSVSEIDAVTGGHRRDIDVGGEAGNAAYDPISHHVFVDVQNHNLLAEVDPADGTLVARHDLPGCEHDHSLLIDTTHHHAFVACDGNARLLEIDLDTFRQVSGLQTGADPDVLALDVTAHRLYVMAESGTLTVIDTTDAAARVLGRHRLADGAHSGTVDQHQHTLYVPLADDHGHPTLRAFEPTGPKATS